MRFRQTLRSIIRRLRPPQPKPLILMYHRIADEPVDPWGLCVHPSKFEEQLNVLRRTRLPLPLTDFVRLLMARTLPAQAVAVTFDDGYADNLFAAKPRLAAADVPATVFLATGYLDRPEEFWWDELARLVLLEDGPQSFDLAIRGHTMRFDLGTEPPARDTGSSRVWSGSLTRRQAAHAALWKALRQLDDVERGFLMAELRRVFGRSKPHVGTSRAMTREQARTIATDGLIMIGAHTVTHPALTDLEAAARRREIVESKAACEALTGTPASAFAYPYGDLNGEVRSLVKGAAFSCACSTTGDSVTAASDIFALPRIQVLDWDGDSFERMLRANGK
jgi:peptidoglycan/xylan/chitin deacetylase (PgdA/CDA1 family)